MTTKLYIPNYDNNTVTVVNIPQNTVEVILSNGSGAQAFGFNGPNYAAIACSAITISPSLSTLPQGIEKQLYSELLQQAGGVAPVNWQVISGSLPPGLTLNSLTGEISGVPEKSGIFTFEVEVTDANGCQG